MIAKLTVHARNREEARQRMLRAMEEYEITGIKTTIPFCAFVFKHEAFIDGSFDTKFVEKYYRPDVLDDQSEDYADAASLMAALAADAQVSKTNGNAHVGNGLSPWRKRMNY